MQTKTYFANSVPAALEVARKELGSDALLVNSKPAPAASRPFGRLEVTFAYDPQPAAKRTEYSAPVPAQRPASEMEDIRQQLSALRMAMGRAGTAAPAAARFAGGGGSVAAFDEAGTAENRLREGGLEADTAREIAEAALRRGGDSRGGDRAAALAQELAGRIPSVPFAEIAKGETRVLALVGPSGRGKTTTLIKIAVKYGIAQRVPVRIYCAGAHGVGCQEQMARYASILGVPLQSCESMESLNLAMNGETWKGLVLIDTPGISPADREGISEMAAFFSRRPEIERHLVLRADARSADMCSMVSRFSAVEPGRLLFTGLDEAVNVGGMVDTLIRTRIPATFAGNGQEIPGDLEQVDVARLVRLICGQSAFAAMAA